MSKLKLRAVFVPRFGSQSFNTPVKEYVIELPPSTSNGKKVAVREKEVQSGGSKVKKGLSLNSNKRVKTTQHNNRQTPSKKRKNDDKSHNKQTSPVLAVTTRKKRSVFPEGEGFPPISQTSCSQGSSSTSLVGDVYTFSQGSSDTPSNDKEKAKLDVRQTISKMLRENKCIRARLTALKQASCNLT